MREQTNGSCPKCGRVSRYKTVKEIGFCQFVTCGYVEIPTDLLYRFNWLKKELKRYGVPLLTGSRTIGR
jgi:hypothetical protein